MDIVDDIGFLIFVGSYKSLVNDAFSFSNYFISMYIGEQKLHSQRITHIIFHVTYLLDIILLEYLFDISQLPCFYFT
jgi:hypothetical protein